MSYDHSPWRQRLHTVIFEADTVAGRTFDFALIACILTSVAVVMLESVASIAARWHRELLAIEMAFTILFTLEYILRLVAVRRPLAYARSLYGVIDLLAVAPTWLALFVPGAQFFLTVRVLRVLRIFRILKLTEYLNEAGVITNALRASRRKIFVFLFAVVTLVVVIGSLIYVVEGPANGFTDIPLSMYWAIVTLTTVGYGDISPQTPLGKLLASFVMIIGYAIIAVPTGIVTSELTAARNRGHSRQSCPVCGREGHDDDATHCKYCGAHL
ncbi:MAG TPA: ion transporter [Thermoanaerobaculia bacterium]|jgi:voltage-gated potassium channel|nr:ion transporter [Thermoanaerobaculia bacterium]